MHDLGAFYRIKKSFLVFSLKFRKYKGLTVGFQLKMCFLRNHPKCFNSLRNRVRKLIIDQDV